MMEWGFPLAGLLVGTMVGATGVGGGSLMTPLLVLLLGVAPHTAIGTDLLYASLTKVVGVGVLLIGVWYFSTGVAGVADAVAVAVLLVRIRY